jgi:CheY-like chemotaxis protein
VLLADDDPVSLRFLEAALRELGCRPTAVGDGHAVMLATDRERFDLLLLDRRMPGMGGAELLSRLRRAGVDAPAIATSAELDAATRTELASAGYLEALLKPIGIDALARAIAAFRLAPAMSGARKAERRGNPPTERPGSDAARRSFDGSAAAMPPGEAALLDDESGLPAVGGDAKTLAALRQLLSADLEALSRERPGEPVALADLLHRLRAACRYCGANRLEHLAGMLEIDLRAGGTASAANLNEFLDCCAETARAIAANASR